MKKTTPPKRSICPPIRVWEKLLTSSLETNARTTFEQHLLSCEACRDVVAALFQNARMVELLGHHREEKAS